MERIPGNSLTERLRVMPPKLAFERTRNNDVVWRACSTIGKNRERIRRLKKER